MKNLLLVLFIFLCLTNPVKAVTTIEVKALMPGMAVLLLDGEYRTVRVGKTTPEGVKLISADTQSVMLEYEGKQKKHGLGSSVSLNFTKPEKVQEKIYANDRGMYMSVGTINGNTVKFLVDTGATLIAMNEPQAKSLGVRYRLDGTPGTVVTASGYANIYKVKLRSVSLGRIKRKNVDAAVIEGNHPGPILLGMSFLDDLHVEKQGQILTLRQKQ